MIINEEWMLENQRVFLTNKEDIKFVKYRNFDVDTAAIALIVTDKQKTPMEAGIFKFNVGFDYTVEADEVIYVLKGCLVIIHEEKEYKAYKGDYIRNLPKRFENRNRSFCYS